VKRFLLHKGSFGFGIKKTLECNNCGAVFEKKGQKYKLSKITDINQPIWIKYGHQILTEDEWIRIGDGGILDEKSRKLICKRWKKKKMKF